MVNVEYMVSYSQILEILKYISKEDYDKIPKDMIELFENNCYQKSNFKYDPEKTLQEQNVTQTTKTIIAILFRDYWATEEQREKIIKVQEQERLSHTDVNDIFKRNKGTTEIKKQPNPVNENLPAIVKQDTIFSKIKNFFKKLFLGTE